MTMVKVGQPVATGLQPKGILVAIEGMDGSGKSTLTRGLADALKFASVPVFPTREPTTGRFGMALRERQEQGERFSALEEYWLFMLDRAEHGRTIRPKLARGEVVISDRYWHSTWVYQIPRITMDTREQTKRRDYLSWEVTHLVPIPDLLIILDLSVEVAQERIWAARGKLDAFETPELLAQYRESYLQLAKRYDGVVMDANRSIGPLVAEVRDRVVALREKSLSTL